MKDIAKWLMFLGIFAIPFIPLLISNSLFFPFITGKNFTFRILVEIIFGAWIILAFYEPQYRPKSSAILWNFIAFLVVIFFADLLGKYPLQSFWNNLERMEGYVTLVHTFMYFLVVGTVLTSQKLWDRYFIATIISAVILSIYAFAQLSGKIIINQGGWRLDGTLGNSAYMAIYMLFHAFIAFLMVIRSKGAWLRGIYGFLTILFIFLMVQTATRGTALGLIGGAFVAVTYMALFAQGYPKLRKIAAGGVIAIITVVALFITYKESNFVQHNPYLQRIASISIKDASTRFTIWSMAFEGVKERPLLGWGQSNYNYVFNKYYRPELHGQEAWFDRVHDIFMDWLIAGGFLGLITYLSVYFAALYYLFLRPLLQKDDNSFTLVERGVLIGLLVGYLIHNIFVFDNIVSYIFYGMILAYIHSRVSSPIPSLESMRIDRRVVEQITVPVVVVLTAVIIYFVNIPGIQAAGDIIQAFRASDPETMLKWFDTALSRNSFADQEIREQMTQKVQSLMQTKEVPENVKQEAFKRTEEELLKQAKEKPGDARVHVFIASFYRMTSNAQKAREQLAIARSLSPNKQLIIYEQGLAELQSGDYAKSTEFFKQAFDLGPQFNESRVYYAMSAIYSGQPELVDELIKTDDEKTDFAVNDLAVQAVYKAKMYPRLIEMFKIQISKKPDDPQVRTNLAYVLSETGDINGAIEVLNKAGEDIPSFKEQSKKFVESLLNSKTSMSTGGAQVKAVRATTGVVKP